MAVGVEFGADVISTNGSADVPVVGEAVPQAEIKMNKTAARDKDLNNFIEGALASNGVEE